MSRSSKSKPSKTTPGRVSPPGEDHEREFMTNPPQSMRAVVAALRQIGAPALLEIMELQIAVGEMELGAQSLRAAVREIAAESADLSAAPGLVSPARLRALADYAGKANATAEQQAAALQEIKGGLAAWNLA